MKSNNCDYLIHWTCFWPTGTVREFIIHFSFDFLKEWNDEFPFSLPSDQLLRHSHIYSSHSYYRHPYLLEHSLRQASLLLIDLTLQVIIGKIYQPASRDAGASPNTLSTCSPYRIFQYGKYAEKWCYSPLGVVPSK